jgi:hypothetical protein
MHMAPRAAAWVAWAEWTCNTPQRVFGQKRAGFEPALFFGEKSLIVEMIDTKRALLTSHPEISAALS